MNPIYGDIYGGYSLTLTGSNLNTRTPTITIDGVDCAVTATTSSSITCTVGARASTYNQANTFEVMLGQSRVAIALKYRFLYVLKWSDAATWGVDIPPVDKDLVYIPFGTTLLVDQNTPILEGIVAQGGTIIFKDGIDIVVRTGFITMNGGTFIAGTY